MISISKLLFDATEPGDNLRYNSKLGDNVKPAPIVVWNCTRKCNLRCIHCYSSSSDDASSQVLTTEQAKSFILDLSEFRVPVILFSGGEPLLRPDIFELAEFARQQGLRTVLSTNGTLISPETADKIKNASFAEVGISLDGIGVRNDRFRGKKGAYEAALRGIRYSVYHGLRVSLRMTITSSNYTEIPAVFDLLEQEGIQRACFYHLAYAGRGHSLAKDDLNHSQSREVLDLIYSRTVDLYRRGHRKEILTVDNHADGIYIYLKLKKQDPTRADRILALLRANGGNNSGIRIGAVDELGDVHADQFWRHYSFGNVLRRKFGEIWEDTSDAVMRGLKERKSLLKGRCAECRYIELCNGNLRVRAEAVYGDIWDEDPACYLTDDEIGLAK